MQLFTRLAILSLSFSLNSLANTKTARKGPKLFPVLAYAPNQVEIHFTKPSELKSGFFPLSKTLWCGPHRHRNSLKCVDVPSGSLVAILPLPGDISSIPVTNQNFVYLGTSKGVFAKLPSGSLTISDPKWPWFPQWGVLARQATKDINQAGAPQQADFSNGGWATRLSGEVIGKPVVREGVVAVLSANQYVYGVEESSGKTLWTFRVGSDSGLRLENSSLTGIKDGFLVGTTDGWLVLLGPRSGQILWKTALQSESHQRFSGIVAPPLLMDDGIVVSNAGHDTQKFSFDKTGPLWSLPYGSVAQAGFANNTVILGDRSGALIGVSPSGVQLWKTPLSTDAIHSIHTVNNKFGIAVTTLGQIHLTDLENGKPIDTLNLFGPVTGSHIWNDKGVCVTLSSGTLHCLEVRKG